MRAVGALLVLLLVCVFARAEIQIQPEPGTTADTALGRLVRDALSNASPQLAALNVRVTIGAEAFAEALAANDDRPLIATYLTSTEFEAVLGGRSRTSITAVFSNPDPRDQVTLAELLLGRASLGVFDSPGAHHLIERLGGRSLHVIPAAPNQRIDSLLRAVDSVDALIVLPDSAVLNRSNINHVVRTLYERRKVLIGYSATLTRVGSLASVYVTPESVARSTVDVLEGYLQAGKLPQPMFVSNVDVAVNDRLARSLNIATAEPTQLANAIQARRR